MLIYLFIFRLRAIYFLWRQSVKRKGVRGGGGESSRMTPCVASVLRVKDYVLLKEP